MTRGWSELGLTFVGDRERQVCEASRLRTRLSSGKNAELLDALISLQLGVRAIVLAEEDGGVAIVRSYGTATPCQDDLERVWEAVLSSGEPVMVADLGMAAPVVLGNQIAGAVVVLQTSIDLGKRPACDPAEMAAALISIVMEQDASSVEIELLMQQRDDLGEWLRALIETDLEGAAFVDAQGVIRFANDRFIETVGVTRSSITDAKVVDFLLPRHRDTVMAMLDLSSQGVARRYSGDFYREDGEMRWLEIEVSPIRDNSQSGRGSWVVITDRTEEKRSNEALLASERWFRALVDQSTDFIVVLDRDGTVGYLSPSAERYLGPVMASVSGHNAFAFIHPEDVDGVLEIFHELLQDPGGQRHLSYRSISPDGLWHFSEVTATNLFDDPDVGGMVINSREVTARQKYEQLVMGQAEVLEMVVNGARLNDALDAIAGLVERVLDGSYCQICWVTPDEGCLSTVAASGLSPEFCQSSEALLDAHFVRRPSDIQSVKLSDDETWSSVRRIPGGEGFGQCELVPIGGMGPSEPWMIMLVFRAEPLSTVTEESSQTLERIRALSQVVIDRTLAEEALAHQSTHDPLTGLANRILLFEGLEHALARSRRKFSMLAVLFIDVDRFKLVNDSLGHASGDIVLKELAARLSSAVRPFDMLARFGGDEFIVICEEIGHPAEATVIADRISEVLQEPMSLGGRDYYLNVSIGIALDVGGSGSPESLVRDADAAMYRAKNRGGNGHEVFDLALRRQAQERLEVEAGLRRALDRDELFVSYQPVVQLPDGEIVGFEALVRWRNSDLGLQLPDRFIHLAEETGLIGAIGAYVLDTACQQAVKWQALTDGKEIPWVSVNLSPRQLEDSSIVMTVAQALERSGLEPSRLCLEITESAAMDESPSTVRTLRSLHRLGIRLAIDDFGTGYSSLSYLKHMPVDSLKIDRRLAAGLGTDAGDSAIVAAVISMATTLGIDVVVEGVENPNQVRELVALNCPYAQGFYFGVPSTAETLIGVPMSLGGLPPDLPT